MNNKNNIPHIQSFNEIIPMFDNKSKREMKITPKVINSIIIILFLILFFFSKLINEKQI